MSTTLTVNANLLETDGRASLSEAPEVPTMPRRPRIAELRDPSAAKDFAEKLRDIVRIDAGGLWQDLLNPRKLENLPNLLEKMQDLNGAYNKLVDAKCEEIRCDRNRALGLINNDLRQAMAGLGYHEIDAWLGGRLERVLSMVNGIAEEEAFKDKGTQAKPESNQGGVESPTAREKSNPKDHGSIAQPSVTEGLHTDTSTAKQAESLSAHLLDFVRITLRGKVENAGDYADVKDDIGRSYWQLIDSHAKANGGNYEQAIVEAGKELREAMRGSYHDIDGWLGREGDKIPVGRLFGWVPDYCFTQEVMENSPGLQAMFTIEAQIEAFRGEYGDTEMSLHCANFASRFVRFLVRNAMLSGIGKDFGTSNDNLVGNLVRWINQKSDGNDDDIVGPNWINAQSAMQNLIRYAPVGSVWWAVKADDLQNTSTGGGAQHIVTLIKMPDGTIRRMEDGSSVVYRGNGLEGTRGASNYMLCTWPVGIIGRGDLGIAAMMDLRQMADAGSGERSVASR